MDDPTILARSMIEMYADGAEDVAKGYAEKHKRSGDAENHALWLQVAGLIARQRQDANGKGA